jgi:hypothetical protein
MVEPGRHHGSLIKRALPALIVLMCGLAILAVAHASGPARGLPLYDGVVVEDPYRYVVPEPGQTGSPSSAQEQFAVNGSTSPALAIVTEESPPQAQLIIAGGGLALPPGTASLTGSITPLAATPGHAQAAPLSNVYRLTVTDQDGNDVPLASGSQATIILRSPSQTAPAVMARWDGSAWQNLPTTTSNQADLFKVQASMLGDYALVPGQSSAEPSTLFLVGLALVAVAVVAGAALYIRRPR